MKKALLFVVSGMFTLSAYAQKTVQPHFYPNMQQSDLLNTLHKSKQGAVEDTLTQYFPGSPNCNAGPFNFTIGGNSITGNFILNDSTNITDVAQVFFANGQVNVEAALVFVSAKKAGTNPGSFQMQLYDDTLSAARSNATAISNSVSFSNIDTGSTLSSTVNRFDFNSPVSITDSVFWLGLQVDNGSDTISVFSTNDDCGGGIGGVSAFKNNFGTWNGYAARFQVAANDPLDIALWMWALVDTNNTIGLSERFLSNSGIASYPNPTQGLTTIEFDMTQHGSYTLLIQDMAGRTLINTTKIFNSGNANRKFEVDLSHLPKGAYTYQVVGTTEKRSSVLLKK